MSKPCWVSGGKTSGYVLHVDVSRPECADYVNVNGIWFTRFRAARALATAINAETAKLKANWVKP